MTVDGTASSITTKRGTKQGCKLAPSVFAIATGLFYRKMKDHLGTEQAGKILTLYADDTLHCADPFQTLESMGLKVNPKKCTFLISASGASAQHELAKYRVKLKKVGMHIQLPDGQLIPIRKAAPYLGVSYNYEDFSLKNQVVDGQLSPC